MDIEVINKKNWFSAEEAAIYTWFKKDYLYKLVYYKKIRHYKPVPGKGSKLIFSRNDLDEWIRSGFVERKK